MGRGREEKKREKKSFSRKRAGNFSRWCARVISRGRKKIWPVVHEGSRYRVPANTPESSEFDRGGQKGGGCRRAEDEGTRRMEEEEKEEEVDQEA